ncbi:MAG: hypothetical protein HY543_03295 [Deltaproteobacteria bacterium]|nr:hypothetical protein [Deltaproteobacteria bacterium]
MTLFGHGASFGKPPHAKQSAEERLLEVIQNGGEKPVAEQRRSFSQRMGTWFGWGRECYYRIRSRLQARKSRPPRKKAARGSAIVRVNQALGVSIVVVLVISVITTFFFRPDIGALRGRVAEASIPREHPDLAPMPLEEVMAPLTNRDLFSPKTAETPAAEVPAAAAKSEPSPGALGVLESFQLVGLAWGEFPEAMIREGKGGRTYFLKQGETLRGVLVKEIRKASVVLEYEGQEKELM